MKVLHIGKYFPPRYGGIETFMSQLMEEQARQGLKVSAIVHVDELQSEESKYTWNDCDIYEVKSYGQLVFAPVAPSYPIRLWRALKAERPDIIHIHMPNLSAFWLLLIRLYCSKTSKIVIHWHSDVLGASPSKAVLFLYPIYRIFEKWLLCKSHKIIATSLPYLETSSPLCKHKERTVVIPLGIKIKDVKRAHNQGDSLKLVMIGRLTYYKNHQYVLEVVKYIKAKRVAVELNIVGSGELEESLRCKTKEFGIQDVVKFHGNTSEQLKNTILSQSDLLLLPSLERTEAFGVVLLEAAMFRLPVIVSNVEGSGMNYVVQDGLNGFVCDLSYSEHLKTLLIKVASDKNVLQALGDNHYSRLVEAFDIKRVTSEISLQYRDIFFKKTGN